MDKIKEYAVWLIIVVISLATLGKLYDIIKIDTIANTASRNDKPIGYCYDEFFFYTTGKTCVTARDKDDGGYAIVYTVKNKKYQASDIDFNKSKIIGKWRGGKSKEARKGFLDGLKRKNKFEN